MKNCPNCYRPLKEVFVSIKGAKKKALSYQCARCHYFSFESTSSKKVLQELQETQLKIKQNIVNLSQNRLGIYFNTHIIRSLKLKKGESLYLSVPDKDHILLERVKDQE